MSCSPVCSCGCGAPVLALAPPPPGETHLRRRVGEFHGFVADLVDFVEQQEVDGTTLGTQVGHRGGSGGAATRRALGVRRRDDRRLQRADRRRGVSPDRAGLDRPAAHRRARRLQAAAADRGAGLGRRRHREHGESGRPGGHARAGSRQAGRLCGDVRGDRRHRAPRRSGPGLTATWVPQPAIPTDRSIRFIGDPGFRVADRVLFVLEQQAPLPPGGTGWIDFWGYLFELVSFYWDFSDAGDRAARRAHHGHRARRPSSARASSSSTATSTSCSGRRRPLRTRPTACSPRRRSHGRSRRFSRCRPAVPPRPWRCRPTAGRLDSRSRRTTRRSCRSAARGSLEGQARRDRRLERRVAATSSR